MKVKLAAPTDLLEGDGVVTHWPVRAVGRAGHGTGLTEEKGDRREVDRRVEHT